MAYINYYGIPCKCTVVKDGVIRTVMHYRSQGYNSKQGAPYEHKDYLRMGFYLYQGTYFKNVNLEHGT